MTDQAITASPDPCERSEAIQNTVAPDALAAPSVPLKVAFLFAGQGAQYPGMGIGFVQQSPAAAEVFAAADVACPGTYERCCAALSGELARTTVTQPTVLATDLACARALEEAGVVPAAVAGFSLGEVGALAFAGAFDDLCAFTLINVRAHVMEEAAQASPGAMRAVLGKTEEELRALLEESCLDRLELVNFNAPTQIVVSGAATQVEAFADFLGLRRVRSVPLAVSGAFHSSFMHSAARDFSTALTQVPFAALRMPVYANLTGEPYPLLASQEGQLSPEEDRRAKEILARQIESPVRWTTTLRNLQAAGITHFIEVGPGSVLTGLVKKTLPQAYCRSVQSAPAARELATELREHSVPDLLCSAQHTEQTSKAKGAR